MDFDCCPRSQSFETYKGKIMQPRERLHFCFFFRLYLSLFRALISGNRRIKTALRAPKQRRWRRGPGVTPRLGTICLYLHNCTIFLSVFISVAEGSPVRINDNRSISSSARRSRSRNRYTVMYHRVTVELPPSFPFPVGYRFLLAVFSL